MPDIIGKKPDLASPGLALQDKFNQGLVLYQRGKLADADRLFLEVIEQEPNHFEALHLIGIIAMQTQRMERGVELIGRAIGLNATVPAAYSNLAYALRALERPEAALACCDRAIELKIDFAEAHINRGNALKDLKRFEEALVSYDRAIALKPNCAEVYTSRGNALKSLKRPVEALASYDKAIALKSDCAEAYNNRGVVLKDLDLLEDALLSHDRAIAVKPDCAEAYNNRGNVLKELKRLAEALASYDKAIALNPDLAEPWLGRGNVFNDMKRHAESAEAYSNVLRRDQQFPFVKGMLLHQKMLCCDWAGIEKLIVEVDSDIVAGKLSAEPFGWQGVAGSPKGLQLCAKLYNENRFPSQPRAPARHATRARGKIRIGYLSGELRDQATSRLIVGVFEHHDNSQFEIYAFDNGWSDQSDIRGRIRDSVKVLTEINQLSNQAAIAAIQENEIDILVNLNGYFGQHRTSVFSYRAAPIQVNYLGFPGTLGATYMDYIVADRNVLPDAHKGYYMEKVAYLPNCYQANDARKAIADGKFTRAHFGLPEGSFVFCCFNNNYKIVPRVFDSWIRILDQVSGSVLWLIEDNASAAANLRKEAAVRGLDSERLIFSKRIPLPDHLARHRLADLFLDTLPCNAHTTASDALWAGLPVLTQIGETFAGRVAASLLNAVGLPELIMRTQEEYEKDAIKLATQPATLAKLRAKLAQNRLTTPLFNTDLFTRHLESAYRTMYERYRAGLPPDHIYVADLTNMR